MGMMVTDTIVFACVAGGAMLGLFLRSVLPAHHLAAESKDVVKLGMGLIATMTALLLGMQVSSAKDSYDSADTAMKEIASKIGYLDRVMATYGPETGEGRESLRALVAQAIDQIWPRGGALAAPPSPASAGASSLFHQLQQLSPDSPTRAWLKAEAISVGTEIARIRWMMFAQAGSSGSVVFMVVVVVWLTLVFTSFGLLGTPNATVIVTLLLCALSVSAAIGLVRELNHPFNGLIQISSEPMRNVLSLIGK